MYTKKARIIALYLPQFHPIPENDAVWGPGFTEWTNTVKARPLFKGHYQPRIPADLGFYDLRLPETREAQANMARKSGIEGFCYWHYWFGDGKVVLERPFSEVLHSGKPDFPFCLAWANHSWTTKTWIKKNVMSKDHVIFEQKYLGHEDNIKHFYYVLPAFKDKRYITVDGKPLFYIYDPSLSPNHEIDDLVQTWQQLAKENGLKGIYFVGRMHALRATEQEILDIGFDAVNTQRFWEAEQAVQAKGKLGRWIRDYRLKFMQHFGIGTLMKFPYKEISLHLFQDIDKKENIFPTIIPQFDRTARAGRQARIWYGSTPELFQNQVERAVNLVKDKTPEHRVIFLSSWNEWAEGSYVEPDQVYGWGYLNAIKNVVIE